jgi:hypothetical protein
VTVFAHIVWGPAPDWLTAIGTVGAFAVALVLLGREQEDRRRAQARRVSVLPTGVKVDDDGIEWFSLKARNNSEEPVYEVRAAMMSDLNPFAQDPEAAPIRPDIETLWPVLLAAEGSEYRFNVKQLGVRPGVVGFSFTDAQGRRWKRLPNGRLYRVGAPSESPRVGCGVLWYGP